MENKTSKKENRLCGNSERESRASKKTKLAFSALPAKSFANAQPAARKTQKSSFPAAPKKSFSGSGNFIAHIFIFASIALIVFSPFSFALDAPGLSKWPPVAYDHESFDVSFKGPEEAVSHIYAVEIKKGDEIFKDGGTVSLGAGKESTFAIQCTTEKCRGAGVYVYVLALGSGGEVSEAPGKFFVRPQPDRPKYKPEFDSISPDEGGFLSASLKENSVAGIKNNKYSIKFKDPKGEFENFNLTVYKNGEFVSSNFYPSATISADCSGCAEGDSYMIQASGIKNSAQGPAMAIQLFTPLSSGIPIDKAAPICDPKNLQEDWLPVMAVGFMALIIIIALAYTLSESLSLPQVGVWAKTETTQLIISALIFVLIAWLIGVQCSFDAGALAKMAGVETEKYGVVNDGDTMMSASLKGLEWSITQTHITTAFIRRELGALSMRATYNKYVPDGAGLIGSGGFSVSPLSGDWTMSGNLNMLLNLNTTFLLSLLFQLFSLLLFSTKSGLFLFLVPIGLVMRSIPFLREAGGGLVAIGVGFYILYPMFLAIIAITLPPLYAGHDATNITGFPSAQAIAENEDTITGTNIFSYWFDLPELKKRAKGVQGTSYDSWGAKVTGPLLYTIDLSPLYIMSAYNFIRAILIPSAGLIIIVSFVRDLAAIFGGEVDASRLIGMV